MLQVAGFAIKGKPHFFQDRPALRVNPDYSRVPVNKTGKWLKIGLFLTTYFGLTTYQP